MAFRGAQPNKENPRRWLLNLVESGVKMGAGYVEVSGALFSLPIRFELLLHCNTLIQAGPTVYAAAFEFGP
jgi:hypothetical protein